MGFLMIARGDDRRVEVGIEYDDLTLAVIGLIQRTFDRGGKSAKRLHYAITREVAGVPVEFRKGDDLDVTLDRTLADVRGAGLVMQRLKDEDTGEEYIAPPAELTHFRVELRG